MKNIRIDNIEVVGLEHLSSEDFEREMENGGRFVMYSYAISILIMTFKQPTSIYFVKGGESRLVKGLPWTGVTAVLGWWGIPWGPIYSIGCIAGNFAGGTDVTRTVAPAVRQIEERNERIRDSRAKARTAKSPA
ncbi:hypothetical protein LBMAG53_08420 [Planctomycetota bacterium]|nr:hypothetical protein LBMAG53_08420 [Planctomycetota bacterium]